MTSSIGWRTHCHLACFQLLLRQYCSHQKEHSTGATARPVCCIPGAMRTPRRASSLDLCMSCALPCAPARTGGTICDSLQGMTMASARMGQQKCKSASACHRMCLPGMQWKVCAVGLSCCRWELPRSGCSQVQTGNGSAFPPQFSSRVGPVCPLPPHAGERY